MADCRELSASRGGQHSPTPIPRRGPTIPKGSHPRLRPRLRLRLRLRPRLLREARVLTGGRAVARRRRADVTRALTSPAAAASEAGWGAGGAEFD